MSNVVTNVNVRLDGGGSSSGNPWVTDYYLGWFWDWAPDAATAVARVDMTTMTHLVFGRYAPGGGTRGGDPGTLQEGAGTGHTQVEQPLIDEAHDASKKALMMIGGAGDNDVSNPGWLLSTDPDVRADFITAILDKCVAKDYDGVDIDWEENWTTDAQSQCISFLGELRTAAGQRARYQGTGNDFLITFPSFCFNINTDTVPTYRVTVAGLVDQFNLMSYDFGQPSVYGWGAWFFGALDGAWSQGPTSIVSSIDMYVDAGVARSKIGMGIGLYGNEITTATEMRATTFGIADTFGDYVDKWAKYYNGGVDGYPGFNMMEEGTHTTVATQEEILTEYVWDETAQTGFFRYTPACPYKGHTASSVINTSMLTLEDEDSIARKGTWTRAGNCGGTIVWGDQYGWCNDTVDNPAMQAIKQAFLVGA